MSHTYTSKGNRRYRYYVCGTAQQRGWSECPSPSVPAGEIERFVVEQVKGIGRDPAVIAETVRQVRQQAEEGIARLNHERAALHQQLRDDNARLQIASAVANDVERVSSLAETQERIRHAERRLTEIDNELITHDGKLVADEEVSKALAELDRMWEALAPREQSRVLELLVERVEYDGEQGNVSLTFHPSGIKSLTQEEQTTAVVGKSVPTSLFSPRRGIDIIAQGKAQRRSREAPPWVRSPPRPTSPEGALHPGECGRCHSR